MYGYLSFLWVDFDGVKSVLGVIGGAESISGVAKAVGCFADEL